MGEGETLHAGCIVLSEAGILIRGPSKSGKSTLARELIFHANGACMFARLVSDDRTHLSTINGRLIARPVTPIAGQIEVRGLGICPVPHEPAAVVRLVIDLSLDDPPRFPETADAHATICGVLVPRLASRRGSYLFDLVRSRLDGVATTS